MNTHITAHKAKVRHQCFILVLCFHLVYAGVPGPCKHSVTQDHLLNLRRLIKNQLQNGCSITYTFTERQNLSVVCYVKAAFPHILELLNTHFRYAKDSDNYRYSNSLKILIYNIYSQRCIPSINEEIEDSPTKFVKIHVTVPRAALEKAEEVIRMYMSLMTQSDTSVDWNCEEEYTEDYPESTTEPLIQTAGTSECPCICPTVSIGSSKASSSSSHWNIYLKSTTSSQRSFSSPVTTLPAGNERTKQLQSFVSVTTQGDSSSFFFGSTPSLPEENTELDLMPSSDVFPSLTNIRDVFPKTIDSSVQSIASGPYQTNTRDNIQVGVERSTPLLLAKRSLDSKNQEGPSSSSVGLSHSWLTATTEPTDKYIKSTEIQGKSFQTLKMSEQVVPVGTTAVSSLKEAAHSSDSLTSLEEQRGHLNTPPETFQAYTQSPMRVPRNFIRTIHEMEISKDHRSLEIKDQTDPDGDVHTSSAAEQSSSTITSFGIVLIIALVCSGLLLITVLFYRQQKVSDKQCIFGLLKRPTGLA